MKTYLPNEFIKSNYHYKVNNDYFTIMTDNHCYSQYSNTYCDCLNIYPNLDYITSEPYSCSVSTSSSNYLSYDNFTSDYWYRVDIYKILLIFLVLFIFIIFFPYKIITRIFGRWFKL